MTGSLTALAIGIAALGASLGDAMVVSNYLKSLARQPELEGKLRVGMFMGIAFAEGTFFIALAMAFLFR